MYWELLYSNRSRFQKVELYRDGRGSLTLLLDRYPQFYEPSSHRYHETFAFVPLSFSQSPPRRALILGGGDGLLAKELLKVPSIEKIKVIELDKAVSDLAIRHPAMKAFNGSALSNPKVEVLNQDADLALLQEPCGYYDLVYADYPDPSSPEIAKLFMPAHYGKVKRVLKPGGVFSAQATSFSRPGSYSSIGRAIKNTFGSAIAFCAPVNPRQGFGFWLAAPASRYNPNYVPKLTRFVMPQMMPSLFLAGVRLGAQMPTPEALTALYKKEAELLRKQH